jgi:hypothetical protein
VAATALAAAVMLGWDRPGVGWFGTGLVAAVAVTVAAWRAQPQPERRPEATAMRVLWAVLALSLLAAGGLRAAVWLWALCLPTAIVCGALALSGGRTLRALILAVLTVPIATVRGLPWFSRGIAVARGRAGWSPGRVAASITVTVVLVLAFGGLLAGADAVFAELLGDILPTVDGAMIARWVFNFLLLGFGTIGACFLALRPPAFDSQDEPRRMLRPFEWALPVGGLVVLFAGFVAVQATVLFGGGRHVLQTSGLTYAEYARQGFWQLSAVTILTLLVLGLAARFARRDSGSDRVLLRVLLGSISVLSLVIVASALSRMWAYTQAYGLTQLRLLVAVCEGWLGLIFIFVLLAGIRFRAAWLPQAVAATAAAALVGIVAVNPDQLIAQQNVDRFYRTGNVDLAYLAGLSEDAVPAVQKLPARERDCVLRTMADWTSGQGRDEWHEWNLGRAQGRAVLDQLPAATVRETESCSSLLYASARPD